jgi:regulator of RNase E activity RraA
VKIKSPSREWRKLGTAAVSDALDRLGILGQCLGIKPLDRVFCVAGYAFTVRMGPVGETKGTVGDYIDGVESGAVVVIDNGGRMDTTVWGDLLTEAAYRQGVGGTIIYGVCRDSAHSLELGYPIFSLGTHMRTGKGRVQLEGAHVPVALGTVRINPGDLIVGDADGVVAVPRKREAEVLSVALRIQKAEDAIRAAIQRGEQLVVARRRFGYHELQERSTKPAG